MMRLFKNSVASSKPQKKSDDLSFTVGDITASSLMANNSADNLPEPTSDNAKSMPSTKAKLVSMDSGFISDTDSPTVSHRNSAVSVNGSHRTSVDSHSTPDHKSPINKVRNNWLGRFGKKTGRKFDPSQPASVRAQIVPRPIMESKRNNMAAFETYPSDISDAGMNPLKRSSRVDRLDAIAETEQEGEDAVVRGMSEMSLKSNEDKSSVDTGSHSASSPGFARKWYQWALNGRRPIPIDGSDSDATDVLKSVNMAESSLRSSSDSVDTPQIQAPGRLPENRRPKKRAARTDLSEEQERAQKKDDIVAIMRGKTTLAPEFRRKYQLLEVIGDGAFGFVIVAKVMSGPMIGKEAAVKFILIDKVIPEGWARDERFGYIPFEAHFLRKISHPNIIKFYDLFKDDKFFYLVTELHGVEWSPENPILNPRKHPGLREAYKTMPSTQQRMAQMKPIDKMTDEELLERKRVSCDLFECIDAHKRISEANCRKIFAGIVRAVDYMHSIGFVHRDLKDENVVIDENYEVKLIDFGSTSKIPPLGDTSKYFDRFNGTLHFASPEILKGNNYRGPEAEVWALGVLLYTIVYGENPFRTPEDILRGTVTYQGRDHTHDYVDLIKRIFDPSPATRISLAEIKRHRWLAKEFP